MHWQNHNEWTGDKEVPFSNSQDEMSLLALEGQAILAIEKMENISIIEEMIKRGHLPRI